MNWMDVFIPSVRTRLAKTPIYLKFTIKLCPYGKHGRGNIKAQKGYVLSKIQGCYIGKEMSYKCRN
jgi:hypothetical protein